ncbi:hypothetical protein ColLi_12157 [Colletotrichum liriopes]|uniref:Uncharacterized protein n=1 Tax=Colletotrichum liriopes TaxID=708192 RepID=A0AA37LYH5_9PEZI|nr:hypothetical protein ColLi_12157 [Colletotrichum liriopes]
MSNAPKAMSTHFRVDLSKGSRLDVAAQPEENQAVISELWAAHYKLQAYWTAAHNESAVSCKIIDAVPPWDMTAREKRITVEFVRHTAGLNGGGGCCCRRFCR